MLAQVKDDNAAGGVPAAPASVCALVNWRFAPSIARGGEFVNFFTSAPEKNGGRVAKCVKFV